MELLWHGTWSHALSNQIDIMFGCASFEGTDPNRFADALSWLGKNAALQQQEDCPSVADNFVDLTTLGNAAHQPVELRKAMASLPPLIKGYLRLGAKVASQAVVDQQFGTTDVLVVLKVDEINPRYLSHFGVDASRYAT